MYFSDLNNGWICGASGTIFHTTDGGSNWLMQTSETDAWLYSVYFINDKIGWIAGTEKDQTNGIVLKTTDGGENWIQQILNFNDRFYKIYFSDSTTGWMLPTYSSHIWKTTDGGQTWREFYLNTQNIPYSISFIDSNKGWICGTNGIIFKTTNSGITWVEDESKNYVTSKSIINAYPNPFYDNITLDIAGRNKPETIIIYDLFGRTVLTKSTGYLEEGRTHKISLSTEDLPQGVYYVI